MTDLSNERLSDELVEKLAISVFDMDADNDTVEWLSQPGRVRTQTRRKVRNVLSAIGIHAPELLERRTSQPVAYTTQAMIDALQEPNTICGTIWPKAAKLATIPLFASPPSQGEPVAPGPWQTFGNSITDFGREWQGSMSMEFIPNGTDEEGVNEHHGIDAAHIARCDPETMRSILTELLSLRNAQSEAVAFTVRPMDTAPSGDDALEPSEIEVHEGSWAILVGTNAKPIGWIDTHETFKGRTYRDRILPAPPPLEIEFITLQTVPQGSAGQHLTVSVRTADGREAEVIRAWGGLPDISIYHTVTESGITAALSASHE